MTLPLSRIYDAVIGGAAAALGIFVGAFTLLGVKEFWNPAAPVWITAVFEVSAAVLAVGFCILGSRRLRCAWIGTAVKGSPTASGLLAGVSVFILVSIVSFPVACAYANHLWPGDGQSVLAAVVWSPCLGIAAMLICWAVLLIRRFRGSRGA